MNENELTHLFEQCHSAYLQDPYPSAVVRKQRLAKLQHLIANNMDAIADAISNDFGSRSHDEILISEIMPSINGIKHVKRQIKRWMRVQRRPTDFLSQASSACILPQPLGVVGIMVPWNYPLLLAISPLTYALAAGNRVMIKMSESAPHVCALLQKLVAEQFAADELAIVDGGAETAVAFSKLAFDHLLFTGSTSTGKKVMQAASENLTPVTLELGGKSPVIVDRDCHLDYTCKHIVFGKLLNSGQTCIAPDYIFVHQHIQEAFITCLRKHIYESYPTIMDNDDYSNIIDERHYQRLQSLLQDAAQKGADVIPLYDEDVSLQQINARKLLPTLVVNATADMAIMQQEIFGPWIVLKTYSDFDEVVQYINHHPSPLALYYFGHNKQHLDLLLKHTKSGGVAINATILHIAQHALPFGGVGESGMGHYHGREGFNTFSKLKPIYRQYRLNFISLIFPPYNRFVMRFLRWRIK